MLVAYFAQKLIISQSKLITGNQWSWTGVATKAIWMVNFVPCSHHKIILVEPLRTLGTFCCKQSANDEDSMDWVKERIEKEIEYSEMKSYQNEELKNERRKKEERKARRMKEEKNDRNWNWVWNGSESGWILSSLSRSTWYEYIWYIFIWIYMIWIHNNHNVCFQFNFLFPFFSTFAHHDDHHEGDHWRRGFPSLFLFFFLSSVFSSLSLQLLFPFSSTSLLLFTPFWFNLYSNLEKFTELNLLTLKE